MRERRILEEDADLDEDVAKLLEGTDSDPDKIREKVSAGARSSRTCGWHLLPSPCTHLGAHQSFARVTMQREGLLLPFPGRARAPMGSARALQAYVSPLLCTSAPAACEPRRVPKLLATGKGRAATPAT